MDKTDLTAQTDLTQSINVLSYNQFKTHHTQLIPGGVKTVFLFVYLFAKCFR